MKNHLTEEQVKVVLDALEKKHGRKTLFVDLDGVVADFEKNAKEHAERLGITFEKFISKKMYHSTPEFYLQLELMPGAKETIKKLDEKYEIVFLSAPSWGNVDSFTEKRLWIEKYFGDWGKKRMDLSFRKGHYMGHYLIDDRLKYGAGDFIGEHIMFGTNPFETWAEVEKYLLK